MRFATKIMVALAVVPAALQAPGDSGLGATNCGFLTVEQCRATLTGGASFTIRAGLPNAPVADKRDGRCARCPTILIRGAPFIQTRGIKTRGNFSAASVAVGAFGFDLKKAPSLCSPAQ